MIRFEDVFKCVINLFKRFDHSLRGFNGLLFHNNKKEVNHVVNPLQRFPSCSAIIGGTMKRIKTEYLWRAGGRHKD